MAIQIFPPNQLSESSPNGWAHWIQQTTLWMVSDSGHGSRPKGCAHWMASGRGHGSSPKGLCTLDGFWQGTWSLLVQILFSIMGKVF